MFFPTDEAFEKQHYEDMLRLSKENLQHGEDEKKRLADELYTLLETYGPKDVEALTLWHNTQALYDRACHEVDRLSKARSKPFFGRIDYTEMSTHRRLDSRIDLNDDDEQFAQDVEHATNASGDTIYIGKVGISRDITKLEVVDWRAPIASAYYESHLGKVTYTVVNEADYDINLARKRTYDIRNDKLDSFYDTDVVANDELLTKYLSQNKKAVLGEIIATIQQEQNSIIRQSPFKNIIVQGAAGSGKTTVAMHRISYILYNYKNRFRPEDFYIVGSNKILLNYITGVLPDLDVNGVKQMTMAELFVRLLYEDWDRYKQKIAPIPSDKNELLKGTLKWFKELETFLNNLENKMIFTEDVVIEDKGVTLLSSRSTKDFIKENPQLSIQSKIDLLNERIVSRLENELSGKEIKYSKEEKAELNKFYKQFFGPKKWTISIYDIYEEFLKEQQANYGVPFLNPSTDYQLYDLAALAYIYKRAKETDPIVEASHIVIDEAQDFGMMAYCCLKYCVRNCTYTIMGDVAQNIHYAHGLNDWQDLIDNFLTGDFDSFELLQKSYRNTVEISKFATDILRHGTFAIYPAQPIIRHGDEPVITTCSDPGNMYDETAKLLKKWTDKGYETIAVIVPDEDAAVLASRELSARTDIKSYVKGQDETANFENGIMVLPVEFTKGLEFDCVILLNPSKTSFLANDANVKLLYVAATRALHELSIIHTDELTDIIAAPIPENRENEILTWEKKPVRRKPYVASSRHERPRLSVASPEVIAREPESQSTFSKLDALIEQSYKEAQARRDIANKPSDGPIKKAYDITPIHDKSAYVDTGLKVQTNSSNKYASLPKNDVLRISSNIMQNFSIRTVTQDGNSIVAQTLNATLTITPYAGSMVRVTYNKNTAPTPEPAYCIAPRPTTDKFRYKDAKDSLLIATSAMYIQIEKSSGRITFCDKDKKTILSEKRNGRFFETKPVRGIVNFEFDSSEKLVSVGLSNKELTSLNNSAKYISHGGERLKAPCILSSKNYGIVCASDGSVLSCQISTYGNFISFDDMEYIDYFFFTGDNREDLLRKYDWIRRKDK